MVNIKYLPNNIRTVDIIIHPKSFSLCMVKSSTNNIIRKIIEMIYKPVKSFISTVSNHF